MAKPLQTFDVRLGGNYWVRCFVWHRIEDSPYSDGTEAAYFQELDLPRKVGEIHIRQSYHDVASAAHEAYHVAEALRRRKVGWSEEQMAQAVERLATAITERRQ